jgi:hypothetical protein
VAWTARHARACGSAAPCAGPAGETRARTWLHRLARMLRWRRGMMIALLLPLALAQLDPAVPDADPGEIEVPGLRWDTADAVPAVLGLVPGHAELEAVRRAIGDAPRVEGSPSARDAPPVRLCYVPVDGGDSTVLLFDAQYDARGEVVEAYLLADAAPPEVQGTPCAVSGRVWRGLTLSNGLRLGMTRAEVVARMGPPTERAGGSLAWERWTGRLDPNGVGVDGYEGMRLLFASERLTAIEVFRAEWRRG